MGDTQFFGIKMSLNMRVENRSNPAHVLKIEHTRLPHYHMRRLHTVDEQKPTISVVTIGHKLSLTGRNGVHTGNRTCFVRMLGTTRGSAAVFLFRHAHKPTLGSGSRQEFEP